LEFFALEKILLDCGLQEFGTIKRKKKTSGQYKRQEQKQQEQKQKEIRQLPDGGSGKIVLRLGCD
jgi:hypothetical protein